MMTRRRFSLSVAFGDLFFAIALFASGLFDWPVWTAGLAAFGMLTYWSWTRRVSLNRLRGAAWASQTGIAISVIIAIMAGAYWLGLGVKGNFDEQSHNARDQRAGVHSHAEEHVGHFVQG